MCWCTGVSLCVVVQVPEELVVTVLFYTCFTSVSLCVVVQVSEELVVTTLFSICVPV